MSRFALLNIRPSFEGYQQLINLYEKNKGYHLGTLELSIHKWFSANLSSALGGILDKLKEELITVKFSQMPSKTEEIMMKNGFLYYYSYPKLKDYYHTTIPYLKLKPTDSRTFFNYIDKDLLNREELPDLSKAAKEKMVDSIYEVFSNAQIHSDTKNIYTCGQVFPRKHVIEFTITDTGMGFKERIRRSFGKRIRATDAIRWAFEDKNTTKQKISGGLGLAMLREFVILNKGKIQVVSDNGFYNFDSKGETVKEFYGSFPGTVVNVQFRTDDPNSYSLKRETDNDLY